MNKIEPGTILTYHEAHLIAKVKVLEDNSDIDVYNLRLEAIEVHGESMEFTSLEIGDKLWIQREKKYPRKKLGWYIDELEEN